ncbi:TOMM precursor leader peptide-binding protein [Ginsengibacter hankyongi]|nr:TOMM precursor leader peptide-binding protein [Ginsengibacter hankyongi]
MMKSYYYLSPGVSVIDMKDGNFLFKSDTLSIKLEGASTIFLVEKILPLLDGENDIEVVSSLLKNVATEDLKANLEQLVKAGVIRSSPVPLSAAIKNTNARYFNNFLEATGSRSPGVEKALLNFKIAVIGLEGHGTQTILALQQAGFCNFKLADPFPFDDDYATIFPFLKKDEKSGSRQASVQKYLHETTPSLKVEIGPVTLTKETLGNFIEDADLCVVCFDAGFAAAFYWVNEICINKNIPALYASVKGNLCFAGPFVIPGKTSCYMCYKMRAVAAQPDFEEAMLYEEFLNMQKKPSLVSRSLLPGAINFMASVLSGEVLKYFFSIGQLSLSDKILEFDTLNFESSFHNLFQKPDCPVCQKKKFSRRHYSASELIQQHEPSQLGKFMEDLVSPHVGIIKKLDVVPKDISEPSLPLVYMSEISNHCFLPKEQHQKLSCSGKGSDIKSAKISAVGEAVERYSGAVYFPYEIKYNSFTYLINEALDPKELVLYLPQQYDNIVFSPFDPNAEIGWIDAWSLVNNKPIYVPAQSAVLNYNIQNKKEFLCQATSNGLAAGSSMLNAVLSAAEEVIERDAFMITWHNKLPCKRIDPAQHPARDVKELFEAYRRRGVELRLFELPTDTPCHIFAGIGVQLEGNGPSVVVGLGCNFSAAAAARQALLEVGQVRPAFKQKIRNPVVIERLNKLLEDPNNVEELEDHDLLYAVPDKLNAFEFLFRLPFTVYEWDTEEEKTSSEKLHALIDFCKAQNVDLIYCNLTPPDMEKLGLYTARVIIPGFQPIHFGYKNIRLGGRRLFDFPVKSGFFTESKSANEFLTRSPHPIA